MPAMMRADFQYHVRISADQLVEIVAIDLFIADRRQRRGHAALFPGMSTRPAIGWGRPEAGRIPCGNVLPPPEPSISDRPLIYTRSGRVVDKSLATADRTRAFPL
jgi:hypothetical protein